MMMQRSKCIFRCLSLFILSTGILCAEVADAGIIEITLDVGKFSKTLRIETGADQNGQAAAAEGHQYPVGFLTGSVFGSTQTVHLLDSPTPGLSQIGQNSASHAGISLITVTSRSDERPFRLLDNGTHIRLVWGQSGTNDFQLTQAHTTTSLQSFEYEHTPSYTSNEGAGRHLLSTGIHFDRNNNALVEVNLEYQSNNDSIEYELKLNPVTGAMIDSHLSESSYTSRMQQQTTPSQGSDLNLNIHPGFFFTSSSQPL